MRPDLAADVPMPQIVAPDRAVLAFTIFGLVACAGLMAWWLVSERRHGPILPLLVLGSALSAVVVEPIFDNTLLYWYPIDGAYAAFNAYGRSVPWWLILGYGWFFGGISYILWRMFNNGIRLRQFVIGVGAFVVVDQVANGIAGWLDVSGFYGPQPFMWGPPGLLVTDHRHCGGVYAHCHRPSARDQSPTRCGLGSTRH